MSNVKGTRRVDVVGVVLPVHDEEELLLAALEGLEVATESLPPSVPLSGCGGAR